MRKSSCEEYKISLLLIGTFLLGVINSIIVSFYISNHPKFPHCLGKNWRIDHFEVA